MLFRSAQYVKLFMLLGVLFAFSVTCFFLKNFSDALPKDMGRAFAHDGSLSAGKPRGTGFIFILVFLLTALLFAGVNREGLIYLLMVTAAMFTGFFDDCSKKPWGEYKKGILDLLIAVMVAITYLNFNGNTVTLAIFNTSFVLNPWIYGFLIVILVWVSINVTNCSDGVDGLSGTLTITTLMSIFAINLFLQPDKNLNYVIMLFVVCILAYLWFNATPSKMLMGDAGSRAMGLFISVAILKTGSPLLYLLVAFMLILDGGLGLAKVFLLRFLKVHILKNVRTPLHDYVRKQRKWSNTQTVFRFAIIQIMISVSVIFLIV